MNAAPDFSTNGAAPSRFEWLLDAADLLAEPDPGPTPWLVERLIGHGALVAAVGRWKTTKSFGMLHVAISVASGRPAFDAFAVPEPGPVVLLNEESGRAALWRRTDALCRGYAIAPEELRGRLLLGPNLGVKLDDPEWQARLLDVGAALRPRLFVFDPLARMKAPTREENAQGDTAVLIEYVRKLRDHTGAAVAIVHHTGHQGGHMRGSSDLESFWESRLSWHREPKSPLVTVETEHREVEDCETVTYRIAYDQPTRTMRFTLHDAGPTLELRIVEHLREHPNSSTENVAKALRIRPSVARPELARMEAAGTTHSGPSGRRDRRGRPIRDKVWNLAPEGEPWSAPEPGRPTTSHESGTVAPSLVPTFRGDGTDEPPDVGEVEGVGVECVVATRSKGRPTSHAGQEEATIR